MKFGFLLDRKEIHCDGFSINTVSDYNDLIEQFYQSAHVSNGWFYGPEKELMKSSEEKRRFKQRGPINSGNFYTIKPTHEIISESFDDDHLRFLILAYGFLQGLYLTPEGYSYIGRIPYQPGKLNGLLLTGDDYSNGMECINHFYKSSNQDTRKQMFACIHWFLAGQSYIHDWDRFDAHYKVLDGIYRLSGLPRIPHAKRPESLVEHYGLVLPKWAKVDSSGKCRLSRQRNELVHEAKYGGHPIGYAYPDENYYLEFTSFNTKLIAAALSIDTPYLQAAPENRDVWGWDIKA